MAFLDPAASSGQAAPERALPDTAPAALRIALVGSRGVPAQYGGFETAVEEVGQRLVARGHQVTVYCRRTGSDGPAEHLGMRLVHLPAVRRKALETLSHTGLSSAHLLVHSRPDAVVLFNAANAPFLPVLRRRGVPVATHVDGLEWQRAKWGRLGRRYYRHAEALAVRWSDALIADARGIADYYRERFGVDSWRIAYGAPILQAVGADRLREYDLQPGRFHLVVARFEPENHVDLAIEGYLRARVRYPLVVVGSAPYAAEHTRRIHTLARQDARVRLLGPVWDQRALDQLYAHARSYVHGHSVGGTNPSLLRAMGAGTAVCAYDVVFNREVLGRDGRFFGDPAALARQLAAAEADPAETASRGERLRRRAARRYRWDDVATAYETLCRRLRDGTAANAAAPLATVAELAERRRDRVEARQP